MDQEHQILASPPLASRSVLDPKIHAKNPCPEISTFRDGSAGKLALEYQVLIIAAIRSENAAVLRPEATTHTATNSCLMGFGMPHID